MNKTNPKTILRSLLSKYENSVVSKDATSTRQVRMNMNTYDKRYTYQCSELLFRQYKDSIEFLIELNFITSKSEYSYYKDIQLNKDSVEESYKWLGIESIKSKRLKVKEVLLKDNSEVSKYLMKRIDNKESNKSYYSDGDYKELSLIIKGINFLLKNSDDLTIRQASQLIYGDTKVLEARINKLINLIELSYKKEFKLSDFNIIRDPSYILLKGKSKIRIKDTIINLSNFSDGLSIPSTAVNDMIIEPNTFSYFLSVENLDTFHSVNVLKGLVMFSSGFHSSSKIKLINKCFESNPNVDYYHFGDIDLGGFRIFNNLNSKSNADFKPFLMTLETLKIHENRTSRTLSEKDKNELPMLVPGEFDDVINYMIEKDVKLEQELINSEKMIEKLESVC